MSERPLNVGVIGGGGPYKMKETMMRNSLMGIDVGTSGRKTVVSKHAEKIDAGLKPDFKQSVIAVMLVMTYCGAGPFGWEMPSSLPPLVIFVIVCIFGEFLPHVARWLDHLSIFKWPGGKK